MEKENTYLRCFVRYGLAAFLIGIVGGFSTVLGPAFVRDIGIAYNNTTWTALAQAMSTAACAPILGKLGDIFGRRKTLFLGIIVFTLGNILTALADSLLFMLIARFVTGIGIAAMSPVILAYIATQFPQDKMAKGFSIYMLISSASVILGPTLGAILIEHYGWRTMIWICVGICCCVLGGCALLPGEVEEKRQEKGEFDLAGSMMTLLFFSLLLCIPSFGQNLGWTSLPFLVVLLADGLSLAGLVAAERRTAHPILPGEFLTRNAFVFSILALFLTQGLMQANMTNLIVFVNHTQPANAVVSGYAISVMYLGMSLGAIILGPMADRYEPRDVLSASLCLTGIGCSLMLLFSQWTSAALLMASLGILGFGLGGNGTITMKVALSGLSPQEAGARTGTYGLFRDLAAPFGVAVFVPLFTNQITSRTASGLDDITAAVKSIHFLAGVEILCVAASIVVARFLPKIRNNKGVQA